MKSIYLCVCLFLTHHNIWAHGYLYKCFISKKENKIYFFNIQYRKFNFNMQVFIGEF